ncbi:MAG TPA: DUF3089 domain-containing protein [Solirubrobacteraceae bacterium]|nr:DUF3089 domain-containing protein [Solirubrobacteraceae bacterium]
MPRLVVGLFLAVGLALVPSASAKTVWLCLPGHHPDPCAPGLSTTVFTPTLKKVGVQHPKPVRNPAIDCFYVYPTVSGQPTGNANLNIDPVERSIALYQAARYSQYCKVYAPMYRQLTLAGIGQGKPTTKPNANIALADVRSAFALYLRKFNHGRGFVLIGHSQGSFVLRSLIGKDVDRKPAVRQRLVSAILMGGNVLVKRGRDVGGDFKHIHACHSATQVHCVIAFSTFDQPVPTPTLFGRSTTPGTQVLCTNPAALGGGSALVDPISPSQPFYKGSILSAGIALLGLTFPHPPTVWWSSPGAYRARCSSANNANVLEITALRGAKTPKASPTPEWGLHLLDANVALGSLVADVKSEAAAFLRGGG